MRRVLPFLLMVQLATVVGCKPWLDMPTPPAEQWVTMSISTPDCRREIDSQDPNSLPYLVCAGAAGTTVRIRSVEAGKVSVDLVLSNQRVVPLSLQ